MPNLPEPPTELRLAPGGEARIQLGGAGSVGYQWTWRVDGDEDIISVTIEAAATPPSTSPDGLRSGSLDQVVVVHALRAGSIRLDLALVRSFQLTRAPLLHYSIDITVAG